MNYDRDFENNNLQNEEKQKSDNNKNEQTDLKIDNRKLDNQEKEKNSQEKEQIQRRWRKQPPEVCWSFIKLLKRLKKENKQVSVIHGHQFGGRNVLQSLNYSFPESDVIIFGHTHRPFNEELGGKLFFNPGSPTDKRLEKNYTFGIIDIGEQIKSEIKILEEGL